jgi:hypothetical protein
LCHQYTRVSKNHIIRRSCVLIGAKRSSYVAVAVDSMMHSSIPVSPFRIKRSS